MIGATSGRRTVQGLLGPRHWRTARPFVVTGAVAIVAGGLVAAANASASIEKGNWAAAYLVLVVGVAQVLLGAGRALLADPLPTMRRVTLEYATFSVGNLGVLAGTLFGSQLGVDLGGVALVAALVGFLGTVPRRWTPWPLTVYRLLIVVVLVSVPVGLVLARLSAGS